MASLNDNERSPVLYAHHREELHRSGLDDEWIQEEGIYSESSTATMTAILQRRYSKKCGPAMVMPFRDPTTGEHNGYRRLKPDNPRKQRGRDRLIKYESPSGQGNRAYVPKPTINVLIDAEAELFVTEGEKKSIVGSYNGFPTIGLVGIYGWKPGGSKADSLIPDLEVVTWKSRRVFICFDSDVEDNPNVLEAENRLAAVLRNRGAIVQVIRLPQPESLDGYKGDKIGLDDFFVHFGERAKTEFRYLADRATNPLPVEISTKVAAKDCDPADLARGFLHDECTINGVLRLRHWRGQFWGWQGGRYQPVREDALTAQTWAYVDRQCFRIPQTFISNMRMALSALTLLPEHVEQPAWLSAAPFPAGEMLATSTSLIHLPSLAAGSSDFSVKPTAEFFSATGGNVLYSPDPDDPVEWRRFLLSVWPEDRQQVETLQEWFGYMLTADTRQQKILLMIGPKRSGKGTIGRVLRELIGPSNAAGPTLAGLATQFGLWPLLGKSLAIIADARLSGRTDRAIVTERLLSISGEDALTIDRKCLQPVTCKLPTRLVLQTNEVPRFNDSSGALASRFVVLRMTRSFYGTEDHDLIGRLLLELPGILNWAIKGWRRLNVRGHFVQPESSSGIVADIEAITSPISRFISDRCIIAPGGQVSVSMLFGDWCQWCEDEGKKPGNRAVFGRDLSALLPEIEKIRPRERGRREWRYSGIRLRTEKDDVDGTDVEYMNGGPSGPRTNGEHVRERRG